MSGAGGAGRFVGVEPWAREDSVCVSSNALMPSTVRIVTTSNLNQVG